MLSYFIFWLTIICIIILSESASLRREGGIQASYFTAGRWRPGRPLKRSILLNYGNNNKASSSDNFEADLLRPQAAASSPFGVDVDVVADALGPTTDEQKQKSSSSIVNDLSSELEIENNNNEPMMLADGFGAGFISPIDGRELNPVEESSLFLMLNSGENYINNQALLNHHQQQPIIITSFSSSNSKMKVSNNNNYKSSLPVVDVHYRALPTSTITTKTTALSTMAPRL